MSPKPIGKRCTITSELRGCNYRQIPLLYPGHYIIQNVAEKTIGGDALNSF